MTCSKNKYFRIYKQPGRPILLLYGTEYGFSEEIAKKLFDRYLQKYMQYLSIIKYFFKYAIVQEQQNHTFEIKFHVFYS